ncbi:hypothetical protein ACIQM3_24905 [Streptomyces sp. NPDC091271]|uniref:hypothetical protein n=1 Tax=Streptomyces sp. NPDC091271 TaxID=3365980 RepID=UPI003812A48D
MAAAALSSPVICARVTFSFSSVRPRTVGRTCAVAQPAVQDSASAVVRLLVMLATNAMDVPRQDGFVDRRPGMEAHAQVILSRFPDGSQFLTNTRDGDDHPES